MSSLNVFGQISDLTGKLNLEWPSLLLEDNYELWKDEWENHGSCYQDILPQHAFFKAALELKEKYVLADMLAEKGLSLTSAHLYSNSACLCSQQSC